MTYNDGEPSHPGGRRPVDEASVPLVIATMLREEGITGVHTHVRQLRQYLEAVVQRTRLSRRSRGVGRSRCLFSVSASSWSDAVDPLVSPGIGIGMRCSSATRCVGASPRSTTASFTHRDLWTARAALHARRGSHQRVVMAVHFRISQADEWADKKQIKRDGIVFRAIRRVEREVMPQVDGLVYVSRWGRNALVSWLPEAAAVPSAVIGNFVAPLHAELDPEYRSEIWSPSVILIL